MGLCKCVPVIGSSGRFFRVVGTFEGARCAERQYYRRESLLEFHIEGPLFGPSFSGTARSQTHVTSTANQKLCYSWLEQPQGPTATIAAVASLQAGFSLKGNITFGNEQVFFEIANSGLYEVNKTAGVAYGAVALNIIGGTGEMAGARGAAVAISYGPPSGAMSQLLFKSVIYSLSPPRAAVEAHLRAWGSDCVNPSIPPQADFTWDSMALTFTTTSNGNVNSGSSQSQIIASYAGTLSSTEYNLSPEPQFKYSSTVGSPTPNSFNETGTISFVGGSFHFSSLADGIVQQNEDVTFGSIAYRVDGADGSLQGAFGVMVDVFESFSNSSSTSFPIHAVAVIFQSNNVK